jgi:large subunit ribosomal protein L7/L12
MLTSPGPAQVRSLGDRIDDSTLLELAALTAYLRLAQGLQLSVGGSPPAPTPVAEGASTVDLLLTDTGPSRFQLVKVVRAVTGWSLTACKRFVSDLQGVVKKGVATAEAQGLRRSSVEAGATVRLEP